jgi:RimJ/RimL family protein N-acetyltransferase
MIQLEPHNYFKVTNPLKEVTINTLFVQAVVEKKVTGKIYVDNTEIPKTFLIVHPYGMSLLFGDVNNDIFNTMFVDYALNTFKIRQHYEWLQAFPDVWHEKLRILFGDKLIKAEDNTGSDQNIRIEENTRVNFKFNQEKYLAFRSTIPENKYQILRTDQAMYENMNGSVVPKYFWTDAEQFQNQGVGFSLFFDDNLVSTAYSSFITKTQLEIGIETNEIFRGKGFALLTCAALIDYSIAHNLEPIWACKFENTGSYLLAQKLGFEPTHYHPYYRLIY